MTDSDPPAEPLPQIRGQRVFLRAAERDDLATFVEWFNDQRVTGFLNFDTPISLPAEEAWFDRLQGVQGRTVYHFVICLRETGAAIGTIGLHDVDLKHGTAEVGIAIGEPELWSKGLGSDALRAMLDFGFGTLRLERIQLQVYDFNGRARRSYEKVGFVHEGTLRKALHRNGQRRDIQVMSVLRDEWQADERAKAWDLP